MLAFIDCMGGGEIYAAFDALEMAVCRRTSAFAVRHGADPFEYYATRPEEAQRFAAAMTANTRPIDQAVALHDFEPFRHVVDVGGSNGTLMRRIIADRLETSGTLFDLPHVVAAAESSWRGEPDAGRLAAVGGSFFEKVTAAGDLYLLKHVLHDWSDLECLQILGNVRSAMPANARLAVIEMVLPDAGSPHPGWAADLAMLALTNGGRERSMGEFRELLRQAEFDIVRVTLASPHISIIEAMVIT